jgi:hypothetical protein
MNSIKIPNIPKDSIHRRMLLFFFERHRGGYRQIVAGAQQDPASQQYQWWLQASEAILPFGFQQSLVIRNS